MISKINGYKNLIFLNQSRSAKNKKAESNDENPITIKGERMKLVTATFLGGLALGVRLLAELFDGDFLGEKVFDKSEQIAKNRMKNNKIASKASKRKQALITLAAFLGISGLFIGAVAIIYTLYKAPKIAYNGKVNAFSKGKDMDVYIKGNKIEKELYNQMNKKAKVADKQEKDTLKMQYATLRMSKNELPGFIKKEKISLQNKP